MGRVARWSGELRSKRARNSPGAFDPGPRPDNRSVLPDDQPLYDGSRRFFGCRDFYYRFHTDSFYYLLSVLHNEPSENRTNRGHRVNFSA